MVGPVLEFHVATKKLFDLLLMQCRFRRALSKLRLEALALRCRVIDLGAKVSDGGRVAGNLDLQSVDGGQMLGLVLLRVCHLSGLRVQGGELGGVLCCLLPERGVMLELLPTCTTLQFLKCGNRHTFQMIIVMKVSQI